MTDSLKVHENRLRRVAHRQGLSLAKSRRRDTRAYDFGTYRLLDINSGSVVWGDTQGYGMSLDEIEAALNEWNVAPPPTSQQPPRHTRLRHSEDASQEVRQPGSWRGAKWAPQER
jgi:hypothetical protein